MAVDDVVVALPRARFQDVVREPGVLDVVGEGHAATARVVGTASSQRDLDGLPRVVGVLASAERSSRPLALPTIDVIGGVAGPTVVADSLATEAHFTAQDHLTVI
jgi:hypothetical protein